MTEKTFVSVFKSRKKADTYVFVRRGQNWENLPEALRAIFGSPEHAMDLVLTPERQLARTTAKEVLASIDEKGFYLQLPEESSTSIVDFGRKLKDSE